MMENVQKIKIKLENIWIDLIRGIYAPYMLKGSHHQQHLKFAQYYGNWTVEDWKKVLWTNETKTNRIGSDGTVYVWK